LEFESEAPADSIMLFQARAVHTWDADVGAQPGDLHFEDGMVVEVLSADKPGSGWWTGQLQHGGATGVFPSNYVERLPPAPVNASLLTRRVQDKQEAKTRAAEQQAQDEAAVGGHRFLGSGGVRVYGSSDSESSGAGSAPDQRERASRQQRQGEEVRAAVGSSSEGEGEGRSARRPASPGSSSSSSSSVELDESFISHSSVPRPPPGLDRRYGTSPGREGGTLGRITARRERRWSVVAGPAAARIQRRQLERAARQAAGLGLLPPEPEPEPTAANLRLLEASSEDNDDAGLQAVAKEARQRRAETAARRQAAREAAAALAAASPEGGTLGRIAARRARRASLGSFDRTPATTPARAPAAVSGSAAARAERRRQRQAVGLGEMPALATQAPALQRPAALSASERRAERRWRQAQHPPQSAEPAVPQQRQAAAVGSALPPESEPEPEPGPVVITPRVPWVEAVAGYAATRPDELSFEEGAQLAVLASAEAWWVGFVRGASPLAVGLFPSNYVERVPRPPEDGRAAALRLELSALRLSALRRRAVADGIAEGAVEAAEDGDNPVAGLVELLLANAALAGDSSESSGEGSSVTSSGGEGELGGFMAKRMAVRRSRSRVTAEPPIGADGFPLSPAMPTAAGASGYASGSGSGSGSESSESGDSSSDGGRPVRASSAPRNVEPLDTAVDVGSRSSSYGSGSNESDASESDASDSDASESEVASLRAKVAKPKAPVLAASPAAGGSPLAAPAAAVAWTAVDEHEGPAAGRGSRLDRARALLDESGARGLAGGSSGSSSESTAETASSGSSDDDLPPPPPSMPASAAQGSSDSSSGGGSEEIDDSDAAVIPASAAAVIPVSVAQGSSDSSNGGSSDEIDDSGVIDAAARLSWQTARRAERAAADERLERSMGALAELIPSGTSSSGFS
jgi:hypothetical protein